MTQRRSDAFAYMGLLRDMPVSGWAIILTGPALVVLLVGLRLAQG